MGEPQWASEAPPLKVTDAAASRVGQLVEDKGNSALKLRVYVEGGGCSGFQYGFQLDDQVREDDMEIRKAGITLLVDSMSAQYLRGAEIDFEDDLSGAQFVVRNPNADMTCGCGSSFSV